MSLHEAELPIPARGLFADGPMWRHGDWICTGEWVAHRGLDLPSVWLENAQPPTLTEFEAALNRYIDAASNGPREPVRFNPPKEYDGWRYQTIKGKAPFQVNADVREFFEDLTPGSRWVYGPVAMRYRGSAAEGFIVARVHRDLGVRFVLAGCDPTRPR